MMCHKMGRPPISTMGFGRNSVSSRKRVPNPPHKMTTFILILQTFSSPRQTADCNRASRPRSTAFEGPHMIVGQKWSTGPHPTIVLRPYRVNVIHQHYIDAVFPAGGIKASTFRQRGLFEQRSHRLRTLVAAGEVAAQNCTAKGRPHCSSVT